MGPSHAELSDERKHLPEDLYARAPLSVDYLAYTDEMEHLHRSLVSVAPPG